MTAKVVTIGLGYIGLPTSALIASVGTKVLGVDIKPEVVNTINKGKIHITEPDLEELVSKTVSKGLLKASTKPAQADVYIIVVPTPFKGNYAPDISFVEAATKGIDALFNSVWDGYKGDYGVMPPKGFYNLGTKDEIRDNYKTTHPVGTVVTFQYNELHP